MHFGTFQAGKKINNKEMSAFESDKTESSGFFEILFLLSLVGVFFSLHHLLLFEAKQTYSFFFCHLPTSLVLFRKNREINKTMICSENH